MHWTTTRELWQMLKPVARQMRRRPTRAEQVLWERRRGRQLTGLKFRRQHPIERFVVDFYCQAAALVIEVDGPVHEYSADEDAIRQAFIESQGLRVLRVTNEQVLEHIDEVIQFITVAAHSSSPSSFTGRGPGGGVRTRTKLP